MEKQHNIENDSIIKNARALLMDTNGNITPVYKAYLMYEKNYIAKQISYQKAYEEAMSDPKKMQMFPFIGKTYQDEIEAAFNKWVSLGYKHQIDEALSILKSIS